MRPDPCGFLRDVVQEHIQLVAIYPDGPVYGHHFGSDAASAAQWATDTNALGYNIYWTVNTCRPDLHGKPGKADLLAARFVHVDMDPPKDGSAWDADAALARLEAWAPSVVIASGGGFQGLWRLDTPIAPEAVETINRAVVAHLDGDRSCWNSDRLLRVPGTINYPDARKRARGRVPALATLLTARPTRFAPGSFPSAPAPAATARERVEMPAYTLRTAATLVPPATGRLVTLIDAPAGEDRSRDCFACAAEMARCGYSDADVLGVLLNPACAVSAHVLDQTLPERAARRVVEMVRSESPARIFADAPALPEGALPMVTAPGVTLRGGYEIMLQRDQQVRFAGCVYVRRTKRIWSPVHGEMDKEQFDIDLGGYEFTIDRKEQGKRTTSAWEAYTRNRAYECPRVNMTCFRPQLPSGAIVNEEGLTRINTYIPIVTERTHGDIAPFTFLLEKMLPDARDREILLHYMASCVQNPGVKFQWWPVIQGTPGNGKTALLEIMMHAMGRRYSHLVNPEALIKTGNQFNGWIENKLFIGFEEIWVGHERRAMIDLLKPLITNRSASVERKGIDQYMSDNCANGMMLTNHKGALPVDNKDRRYAFFFTAQQDVADLTRDGLTEEFFASRFYPWLFDCGFQRVTQYLADYHLRAALDPARHAVRAPDTSSRSEAVALGVGKVEQEVLAAIEEEVTGFRGGFVSSRALDMLLDRIRSSVPRNQRAEILSNIGYLPHPHLPDGRTTRAVMPDGVRVRLYVRTGHLASQLGEPVSIQRRYEEAQSVVTPVQGVA